MMTQATSTESSLARSFIVGTAGHIDHGKTALVRALTGIDTDRLPEEKRRGITIDLGFASFAARAADGSPLQLAFIDVPGHARFVRNMLAGAGGIDAVLLTIAADEGVMPQTREHLAICSLLGVERGMVVLTKADTVSDERLAQTASSVSSFLGGTFLASAPRIAVSAHAGSGIAEVRRIIVGMASNCPRRRLDTILRLPIDRAFVIKGFGTVVTGTLFGGRMRTGDELEIAPGGRTVRVRGIQVHNRVEQKAIAGSRVALNLAHVETADLKRGNTLISPASAVAIDTVDVHLSVLPGAQALKHRSRVHFHAFASECVATATLYDASSIEAGEAGLARLRLSEPVVLLPEDRFVLRTGSPVTTIGGGRVLDAYPEPRTKRKKTAQWLRKLAGASAEESIWLRVARREVRGITGAELSRETGVTEETLHAPMLRWLREGRVHCSGEKRWLTQQAFAQAQQTVLDRVLSRSRNRDGNPVDIRRSELKEQTRLDAEVFLDALRHLEQESQLQLVGEFVLPPKSASTLNPDDMLLLSVATNFKEAGLAVPSPEELGLHLNIAPAKMRQLITHLLRDKTLVRLNDDSLCVDRLTLAALADRIGTLRGQTLSVAEFKELTGVSRKFAIPLLEYLDRERVTVRRGDLRLVL